MNPCTDPEIPAYLHTENKPALPETDFEASDLLYRSGNPLVYPNGKTTALSCKWSKLIKEEDVLKTPPKGETSFCYATVEMVQRFEKIAKGGHEAYSGLHKLTNIIKHSPTECDYSHSEILIKHEIFADETLAQKIMEFLYTYESWDKCLLNGKARFYKELRSDYRLKMIKEVFIYPLPC